MTLWQSLARKPGRRTDRRGEATRQQQTENGNAQSARQFISHRFYRAPAAAAFFYTGAAAIIADVEASNALAALNPNSAISPRAAIVGC